MTQTDPHRTAVAPETEGSLSRWPRRACAWLGLTTLGALSVGLAGCTDHFPLCVSDAGVASDARAAAGGAGAGGQGGKGGAKVQGGNGGGGQGGGAAGSGGGSAGAAGGAAGSAGASGLAGAAGQ